MQFFEKNLAKTNLWLLMIIVSRCSTLRPWVGYFIFYKLTSVFFQWTLFSSIKEVNRLLKETNRLLSKELSNIYLSVTIEKKWRTQNQISLNFQTSCCNLKVKVLRVPFLSFLFWKELWRFKVKESMLFVKQNINFNKNETESKMENPTHSFRDMNLVLQLV